MILFLMKMGGGGRKAMAIIGNIQKEYLKIGFGLKYISNLAIWGIRKRSNNIPLPSDGAAMDFIIKHRDKLYGRPFEGVQFSVIGKIHN